MRDPVKSMRHLAHFLDFDEFNDNMYFVSILAFQGKLKYFVSKIEKEILQYKLDIPHPDRLDKLIVKELKDASDGYGGNYDTLKKDISKMFGYDSFDLHTDLDPHVLKIRMIFVWSIDLKWDIINYWGDVIKDIDVPSSLSIGLNDLGLLLRRVIYQDAINEVIKFVLPQKPLKKAVNHSTIKVENGNEKVAKVKSKDTIKDNIEDEYITRKEVAKMLNCCLTTVDNYAKRGIITKIKLTGRKVLFNKKEILDKLEELKYNKHKRTTKY